jgi:hypothetical protein
VKVAGTRWCVGECFQAGKNEAGLDHYQVRLYKAWYRYITLAMLALAWLAVTRAAAVLLVPTFGCCDACELLVAMVTPPVTAAASTPKSPATTAAFTITS